ncbi:MAG: glycosyltransferase [Actinomycetota bacterium]|nr:glycosyltransferase [Actinomycetota bacterium]
MKSILTFPEISVSIVNLNGEKYLKCCLDSLKELNYPQDKLEIILIDNNSTDESLDLVKSGYPYVKIIKNGKNMGFACANNQAAKVAGGEYIAFLNNDTRVDKNWLIELLKPIYKDKEIIASGSKVLSIDGKNIDFVGGMINFEGKGFQIDYDLSIEKDHYYDYRYLPFVNGGAMLVNREIFLDTGGFDEDFFAYYEDVDFGWRLWVLGYRVVFAPKSIVYHHHHGTSKVFSEDRLRFLKERNSLYSVFKNYDENNLARVFSGSLANIFSRIFVDFKFDYKNFYDLSNIRSKEIEIDNQKISKEPLSSLMAVNNFLDDLPELIKKRQVIQEKRKRDDKAIFTYFKGQFLAVSPDEKYQKNQVNMLKSLGIYDVFEKEIRRKILIVSSEIVSKEMAGPAIRVWNFAKILSEHFNVVLAVPNKVELPEQTFELVQFRNDAELSNIIKNIDIILTGGMTFSKYKSLKKTDKYLIIDIYDPYNLATLAEYEGESIKRRLEIHKSIYSVVNEQLHHGDFFICASERQRDFWLGMLAALNRINPYTYNEDPTLRKTIDVVPFGLPDSKPMHTRQVLKGKVDGIKEDDFVIIWGGGIYNWFDPLTLIKVMAEISKVRNDIKLFFMGVEHPNPEVKKLQLVNKTINLAKKLGIYDKNVFFNFGWVEYDDRQNYLLESDAGIITHPEHIETRFSFRTRILDYLWAGLPIISTKGDSLSDMVEKENLGITVNEKDVTALVNAILKIADDKDYYSRCVRNIENTAKRYTWEKVCEPLIRFCKDPIASACKNKLKENDFDALGDSDSSVENTERCRRKNIGHLTKKFFYHLMHNGFGKTLKITSNYIQGK